MRSLSPPTFVQGNRGYLLGIDLAVAFQNAVKETILISRSNVARANIKATSKCARVGLCVGQMVGVLSSTLVVAGSADLRLPGHLGRLQTAKASCQQLLSYLWATMGT